MCRRTVLSILLSTFPAVLPTYAQGKPQNGATVAGKVTLADTGGPARFATVYLKSVTPVDTQDDFHNTVGSLDITEPKGGFDEACFVQFFLEIVFCELFRSFEVSDYKKVREYRREE